MKSVFVNYGASKHLLDLDSCLPCVFWGKPWVFRERAPRAPHFFQLCFSIYNKLIILDSESFFLKSHNEPKYFSYKVFENDHLQYIFEQKIAIISRKVRVKF